MPKLSLWKTQKSNDYRFFDRTISEMYTVGATDLYVHKYIGTNNPTTPDLTQPVYDTLDPTNIQDLLFLENRDRKYDPNVYRLRGHYNVQNLDFDLSQFGLFLTNDIIFVTVHYNDMIDIIGRKLMVGDVFELPHLTDYHPLNQTIPIGLRRYYQITDANFASEGFSQTWFPHLWRIKCEPLTDSQEFASILNQPIEKDNYMGDWDPTKPYQPGYTVTYNGKIYTPTQPVPPGTSPTNTTYWELTDQQKLKDIISTYNKNIEINEAVIEEAKRVVPLLGYDRSQLYVVPTFENGELAPPTDVVLQTGSPSYPAGTVEMITGIGYRSQNPAIRIPSYARVIAKSLNVRRGYVLLLREGVLIPNLTDSGSGPVSGYPMISTEILEAGITGPYGTADNTYATSDQYMSFTVTALDNPVNATIIAVQKLDPKTSVGLTVQASFKNKFEERIQIFSNDAVITAVNFTNNTFTISHPTTTGITAGTRITVAGNFTGEISAIMNFQADCDPRFQFIRRQTPRSFGYITGYNSGDGTAPNGLPVQAGTVFPVDPKVGDYCLRLDYLPQRLFRFDGRRWVEISRNIRNPNSLENDDQSQISTFINNSANVITASGTTVPSRQSLSKALRITPDE